MERYGVTYKRAYVYYWRVSFAFGGEVRAWGSATFESQRKFLRNRSENDQLWAWFDIPSSLVDIATGVCASTCVYVPTLPYNWCEGDASCLPTTVSDTINSAAVVAALESTCGLASGSSQRPDACTNRPYKAVDCGFVTGSVVINPPKHKKWPKNLSIRNERHSGPLTARSDNDPSTPTFDDLAEFPVPTQKERYKDIAATDGQCDVGAKCDEPRSFSYIDHDDSEGQGAGATITHSSHCSCSNNNLGCGGSVDDTDCAYGYTIRDSYSIGYMSSVHQGCWDFCSNYVDSVEPVSKYSCATRELLATGGELWCGYKAGKYSSYQTGLNSPYYGDRCNVFMSPGPLEVVDYSRSDSGTHSAGPYESYYMSETKCNPGSMDMLCAPPAETMCAGSTLPLAAAQGNCSQLFVSGTTSYENCVYSLCVNGCTECESDPDDPGPQVAGNLVPPAVAGEIIGLSVFATAQTTYYGQNTDKRSFSPPVKITFSVNASDATLFLVTIGPLRHWGYNRNTVVTLIVDDTTIVAVSNTANAKDMHYDHLALHGVASGLSEGVHTVELLWQVRCMQPHQPMPIRPLHAPTTPSNHSDMRDRHVRMCGLQTTWREFYHIHDESEGLGFTSLTAETVPGLQLTSKVLWPAQTYDATASDWGTMPGTSMSVEFGTADTSEKVLLIADVSNVQADVTNTNVYFRILVDGTHVVANWDTGDSAGWNYRAISFHGVATGLRTGYHSAELQFKVTPGTIPP